MIPLKLRISLPHVPKDIAFPFLRNDFTEPNELSRRVQVTLGDRLTVPCNLNLFELYRRCSNGNRGTPGEPIFDCLTSVEEYVRCH